MSAETKGRRDDVATATRPESQNPPPFTLSFGYDTNAAHDDYDLVYVDVHCSADQCGWEHRGFYVAHAITQAELHAQTHFEGSPGRD